MGQSVSHPGIVSSLALVADVLSRYFNWNQINNDFFDIIYLVTAQMVYLNHINRNIIMTRKCSQIACDSLSLFWVCACSVVCAKLKQQLEGNNLIRIYSLSHYMNACATTSQIAAWVGLTINLNNVALSARNEFTILLLIKKIDFAAKIMVSTYFKNQKKYLRVFQFQFLKLRRKC